MRSLQETRMLNRNTLAFFEDVDVYLTPVLGTPVPERGMIVGELVPELDKVRVPVRAPRVVGVKVMVTGQLEPGVRMVVEQGAVTA